MKKVNADMDIGQLNHHRVLYLLTMTLLNEGGALYLLDTDRYF